MTSSRTSRPIPAPTAVPRAQPPSTEITRHLLKYLLSGDLTPGERIPSERQLAEALEIGRSGVREAIKSLCLLGLLEVRQGDGTYLTGSTSDLLPDVIEWGLLLGERRILDLVEVRSELEVFIAELAAERRTPEQAAALSETVEMMYGAGGDGERHIELDVQFHRILAESTANKVLVSLSHSFSSLLRAWSARCVRAESDVSALADEHAAVARAIDSGSGKAGRAAMTIHMAKAAARLNALPSDA